MNPFYILYIDESGDPGANSNNDHFVLVGLAIEATTWKAKDIQLAGIKSRYRLADQEIHTAWAARNYPQQQRIPGFDTLSDADRRNRVLAERRIDIAQAAMRGDKAVRNLLTNFRKSEAYIHLTLAERTSLLRDCADAIGSWADCRIFGDAQMRRAHVGDSERIRDFAFEQVVTRFHHFLARVDPTGSLGIVVHDRNETAAKRLTAHMRSYHARGTAFAQIPRVVETPLFVDSQLTSMVQMADLAGFAVRRFLDNQESDLFDRIYSRFDRTNRLVGLRHFTAAIPCACIICNDHGR